MTEQTNNSIPPSQLIQKAREALKSALETETEEKAAFDRWLDAAATERFKELGLQQLGRLEGLMPISPEYKAAIDNHDDSKRRFKSAIEEWHSAAVRLALWVLETETLPVPPPTKEVP